MANPRLSRGALRQLAKDLLDGRDVVVGTIRDADAVLKIALPNARKIKGTGPNHVPDFMVFRGRPVDGVYHKDYWFDSATGRIYGHDATNPHARNKHINVKLPDGRKATIIIQRPSVMP